MGGRFMDWIGQARADLRLARTARDTGSHEWSCFASQQAAEKALKGLFDYLGGECWGHSLTMMFQELSGRVQIEGGLADAARRLDKLYIPTRYPNGFDAGKPADYFTREDADAATADAEKIIVWVEERVRGPQQGD
jgi:HEPN domain-containing protein